MRIAAICRESRGAALTVLRGGVDPAAPPAFRGGACRPSASTASRLAQDAQDHGHPGGHVRPVGTCDPLTA